MVDDHASPSGLGWLSTIIPWLLCINYYLNAHMLAHGAGAYIVCNLGNEINTNFLCGQEMRMYQWKRWGLRADWRKILARELHFERFGTDISDNTGQQASYNCLEGLAIS